MRITQLTLKNFRCFGPEPETIDLDSLTAIIGSNGCGKTAALMALARLFGVPQTDRHLQPEDFHVPANRKRDELDQIDLLIEARIEFPELRSAPDDSAAIPPCFNQMVLGEGADLFCRVRLEGKWTRSTLAEGDIEEKAFWITTAEEDVTEEDKRPMQGHERSLVHVLYVPAFRDASKQVAQASGSILYRLLRAIEWSDAVKNAVEESAQSIRDSVQKERAVKHLHECLGKAWRKLHDMPTFQTVTFQPVGGAIDELLKQVEVVFGPGGDGREHPIERLSEGLKSLFYFSLVASLFQIEEEIKAKQLRAATDAGSQATGEDAGTAVSGAEGDPLGAFSADRLRPPALTIFAVEEPENHLSPHYLGRIMELLQNIAAAASGQVLLTSHSPSIMSRIDPERVRYLRLDPGVLTTRAKKITLPSAKDEAFKYVKEAVRAYPELYFARLVVLCEGDSEEVVIPQIAKASGIDVDTSLISVVPLGGRHVNHFWKLLHDLDIPHLTLLDFDRERLGGGWGRVHYAYSELIKRGVSRKQLLEVSTQEGGTRILDDAEFAQMPKWKSTDEKSYSGWLSLLETHGVFFSSPLDLDFLMLRAFPTHYQAVGGGKPTIPKEDVKYAARIKSAIAAALKDEGGDGSTYTDDEKKAFIWYSYLFLGKGKPTTHVLALNQISAVELAKDRPPVLGRLMLAIRSKLPSKNEPPR